ncbi:MAG TPA: hypothetical protein VK588_01695 [Chitinophagaceae bacterium]|nr:hypothetical protein [Chitinophagaceae bacterium]
MNNRNKSPSTGTKRLVITGILIISLAVITAKLVNPNNWQGFATIVTSYFTLAMLLFSKNGDDGKSENNNSNSD